MKRHCVKLVAAVLATTTVCAQSQELDASENPWSQSSPAAVGRELFAAAEYDRLETLATRLVRNRERMIDGRYQVDLLESGIEELFSSWTTISPGAAAKLLADWKVRKPASSYRPIIEVISLRNDAWQARGDGYAAQVTPKAMSKFRALNAQSWKVLMDSRKGASTFPGWYSAAIGLGFELDMNRHEIDALFDEGIKRFPGQLSLYFSYLNYLQPKWGSSFEQMDEFIRRQVASPANPHGEALYARMYWFVNQCDECGTEIYFESSKLDWKRLRKSFDGLLVQYPDSQRILAVYAGFACRASDATTYHKLRGRVQPEVFGMLAHQTLEECDAKLAPSGRH